LFVVPPDSEAALICVPLSAKTAVGVEVAV